MSHLPCDECGKAAEKCTSLACQYWREQQIRTAEHFTFECTASAEPAHVRCSYCGRVITTHNLMIIMTQTCMECHEALGEILSTITNKYKFKPITPETFGELTSEAERLFLEKRGRAVTCDIIGVEAGCARIQMVPKEESEELDEQIRTD